MTEKKLTFDQRKDHDNAEDRHDESEGIGNEPTWHVKLGDVKK